MFLEILQSSHENTRATVFFNIQASACNFIKKETQAQVFEFCEISKNTFSHRTPPVTASVSSIALFILYITRSENPLEKFDLDFFHRFNIIIIERIDKNCFDTTKTVLSFLFFLHKKCHNFLVL